MPADPELLDLLALTLVPGLGPRLTQAMLAEFGSFTAARGASPAALERIPRISARLSEQFAASLREVDPQAEFDLAASFGVSLLPKSSPDFPARLAELPDSPHLLYVRGAITTADEAAVAIVGSRRCTDYGRRMAHRIAGGLTRAGHTVVSGLALGIDGAAHRGALEAGGRTLAVLAGGLSRIYPPEHASLADDVAASGALVTESSMTMDPQKGLFHSRNRIISGLSRAVVIIEANDKSGALITARHAAEQGRDVFVLPANADSTFSAGSLRLLRDGAKLIRDLDDLLDDLKGLRVSMPPRVHARPIPAAPPAPTPTLDPTQQRVWDYLTEPRHSDEIIRHLQLPVGEVKTLLLKLEMKKVVRLGLGGMFERR